MKLIQSQEKTDRFREELQKSIGAQPYRMWFDSATIDIQPSVLHIKTNYIWQYSSI